METERAKLVLVGRSYSWSYYTRELALTPPKVVLDDGVGNSLAQLRMPFQIGEGGHSL